MQVIHVDPSILTSQPEFLFHMQESTNLRRIDRRIRILYMCIVLVLLIWKTYLIKDIVAIDPQITITIGTGSMQSSA